eukprot:5775186-Prorocentrum_lima.AAC.1
MVPATFIALGRKDARARTGASRGCKVPLLSPSLDKFLSASSCKYAVAASCSRTSPSACNGLWSIQCGNN